MRPPVAVWTQFVKYVFPCVPPVSLAPRNAQFQTRWVRAGSLSFAVKPAQVLSMNVQLTAFTPCTLAKHAPARLVGPLFASTQL